MFEQYIANDYLRVALILVGLFVILRVFVFVLEKFVLNLTSKTKTDLDDLIVKKSSKAVTFIVLLVGLRLALVELPLPDSFENIIYKLVFSLVVLSCFYLVYVILDLSIVQAWKRFAKKTKSEIDDSLVSLIHGTLNVVWIVVGLLYVLDFWGVKVGPFLAGLGIAGIAIAFALQSSLSNVFGGISMILDRSVRVGDLVYLDDGVTKGKIMNIGLRSTRIQTFDNEMVILPNGKLADSKIQNVALPEPKVRVVIPFSVAYGSDIDKVKKIVLKEIKSVTNVLKDPEPAVHFREMAESSLNFKAFFYVESFENRFAAEGEANTKIYNALNKNKISIPFPQMDVHLKKD